MYRNNHTATGPASAGHVQPRQCVMPAIIAFNVESTFSHIVYSWYSALVLGKASGDTATAVQHHTRAIDQSTPE